MPHSGSIALLAACLVLTASHAGAQAARPDSRYQKSVGGTPVYSNPAALTPSSTTRAAPASSATPAGASTGGNTETIVPTSRVSSGISSAITAGLPKYQAPKPPEPVADKQPEPARRRDPGMEEIEESSEEALPEATPIAADQPKNKIIRLPKYVVEADRPPVFKEREILTKQALAELAVRRYLSRFDSKILNRFTLPIIGVSPEQRALAMYAEDVRLENISELKDAAASARRAGDKSGSDYILKETDRTFMRSGGMDWTTRRE